MPAGNVDSSVITWADSYLLKCPLSRMISEVEVSKMQSGNSYVHCKVFCIQFAAFEIHNKLVMIGINNVFSINNINIINIIYIVTQCALVALMLCLGIFWS